VSFSIEAGRRWALSGIRFWQIDDVAVAAAAGAAAGQVGGGSILFNGVDLLQISEREMRDYRGGTSR